MAAAAKQMMISEGGWKLQSYFQPLVDPKFMKFRDDVRDPS